MYSFIICEDIDHFNNSYQNVITQIKKKLNIEVNIYSFKEYNEELKRLIFSNIPNKIYILDLLMPKLKGTEIADMIRETDFASSIIFITSYHDEYEEKINDGEYLYLKYIDKEKDYKSILFDTLERHIKRKRENQFINIEVKTGIYRINPYSITHVYTENRKLIIKDVLNNSMSIPMSLKDIASKLPDCFLLSKNCCLVNAREINVINKKDRIITFNNGFSTDLVSKKYLKIIIDTLKKYPN